jgi:hypothetical protein
MTEVDTAPKATAKIEFVAAIMCDDLRYEADGGFSLMGTSSSGVDFSRFPARRQVAFGLVVNTPETGVAVFTIGLKWNGERKWAVEQAVEIQKSERGALLPIDGTTAMFDGPGKLVMEVEQGGKTSELQSWDVGSASDEEL